MLSIKLIIFLMILIDDRIDGIGMGIVAGLGLIVLHCYVQNATGSIEDLDRTGIISGDVPDNIYNYALQNTLYYSH